MQDKELIIEANTAEANYWKDLWVYRELFYVLAWRDISVRYKQTVIGVLWAVLRPFLTMLVFTIVFSVVAKLPSQGEVPYALMVFAGMLPWNLFSNSLNEASNSLVGNSSLISKVYFPRLIIPAASVITSFVDFVISFLMMICMMVYYKFIPGWQILMLPFFIILTFLVSLGPSLWLGALNVKYRDFRYIIPFIIQFGLYISPVGFSSKVVPEEWLFLYRLNPIVGVIDGFRWCLLGDSFKIAQESLLISIGSTVFFMIVGVVTFRRMERKFADVI